MANIMSAIRSRVRVMRGAWKRDPRVTAYLLLPGALRRRRWTDFLLAGSHIRLLPGTKRAEVRGMTFSYLGITMKDFIREVASIVFGDDEYVKNNFLADGLFNLEGPYEAGGARLRERDVVIDAGANIGVFTVFAARRVGPNGHVYAFEPIQKTRSVLLENISMNGASNVTAIPCALSDRAGEAGFSVNDTALGSSSGVFVETPGRVESVEVVTLDDFVEREKLARVDFIKADIEGMEKEMLKGATRTIQVHRPRLALCTYHYPEDPATIEALLRGLVPEYSIIHTDKKIYAWVG